MHRREAATPRTAPPSCRFQPLPLCPLLLLRCVLCTLWAHGAPLTGLPHLFGGHKRLGWNAAQAAEPEPQPALPSKESILINPYRHGMISTCPT